MGINAGDVKKAKDAGFHTINCLLMNTKKSLLAIKGLSEAKIEKMIEATHKLSPVRRMQTTKPRWLNYC
eukprot:2859143-Pyramimonas_sp.AAC.1